jgi:hypothetical protein
MTGSLYLCMPQGAAIFYSGHALLPPFDSNIRRALLRFPFRGAPEVGNSSNPFAKGTFDILLSF